MSEITLQDKLAALGQEFSALQHCSQTWPDEVRARIPEVIADLHGALGELGRLVAALPGGELVSNGSAGKPSAHLALRGRVLDFRRMAERGPVLVRIMSTARRCRWVNRAWLEFTGRGLQNALGDGWLEDVHPDDRARCQRLCRETLDASRLERIEYRLRRGDGEYGWVLEIATPRASVRGKEGGYAGTAIDITAQKRSELQLSLQSAVSNVLTGAADLSAAAQPLLAVLCDQLGWELGELWCPGPDGDIRCEHVWSAAHIDAEPLRAVARTRTFHAATGSSWQSAAMLWVSDLRRDENMRCEPEVAALGMRTLLRQPIRIHGETLLVLRLFSARARPVEPEVQRLLRAVAVLVGQFAERRLGEERLRISEARKAAILEAALDAVVTLDARGRILEFNAAAQTLFGYPRQVASGREFLKLAIPCRLHARAEQAVREFRLTGQSALLGQRFEATGLRADGQEFPIEVAMMSIGVDEPSLLTLYISDLSARKRSEQQVNAYQERLRALMADLVLVEERERRSLAEDLHDGLSQTIALTRMKVAALRAGLGSELGQALDEIETLIDHTNRSARSIGFELSPPVLHDLGLGPALQWLVENIQTRYGVAILLQDEDQPDPSDERTRVILFRSIRELLINAAKHAGARHISVRVERAPEALCVSVADDGVGMDSGLATEKGSGLMSIRERKNHVGGSMKIDSAPGFGTKISLSTPLSCLSKANASMQS